MYMVIFCNKPSHVFSQLDVPEDIGEIYKVRVGFAADVKEEQSWRLDTVNTSGQTHSVYVWISNFIPYFIMDIITFPCWD